MMVTDQLSGSVSKLPINCFLVTVALVISSQKFNTKITTDLLGSLFRRCVEGITSKKLTLLGDIPFIYFSFSFHFVVVVVVVKKVSENVFFLYFFQIFCYGW